MTLLICPVRPGDQNEELRYAMRSWEQNLLMPDLTLMTVGHKPSWLKPDVHVEGNAYRSMPLAVLDNIIRGSRRAVEIGIGGVDALYMNDDFFCMDPMDSVAVVRRNQTLAEHIESVGKGGWWAASLARTADWLSNEGFPYPDSFEVHRPLRARPDAMLWALEQIDMEDVTGTVPQWRTVYGTLCGVWAAPAKDAKIGMGPHHGATGVGTPWLSTDDTTWRTRGEGFRKRFQKPSRWEIVTS